MSFPGKTSEDNQKFELAYWEKYGGVEKFDLHLPVYRTLFPLDSLDYQSETIMDVGSGAISVFDKLAPTEANVLPFDILAEHYNRIAPDKKFSIQSKISEEATFSLITLFNMLDHVDYPDDVLAFVSNHLAKDGRVWIATHLEQPHGAKGHPQKFSYLTMVSLLVHHFSIESFGIIREGIPIPYLWHAVLRHKNLPGRNPQLCILGGALSYYRLQSIRIVCKLLKLFGLRPLLPQNWQF